MSDIKILETTIFLMTHGWLDGKYMCLWKGKLGYEIWTAQSENCYFLDIDSTISVTRLVEEFLEVNEQGFGANNQYVEPSWNESPPKMNHVPRPMVLTVEQEIGIKIALQDPILTDMAKDLLRV